MRFQCSQCLGIVGIDDDDAGQAVACGHCGRVVVVPSSRFAAGAVVNDFALQKELGKGGVGTVYLAQQLSLARPVALKILHPRLCADHEYVADFIQEARAAAQLNHPNIVQAYAVGEEEGVYYFAMEYVEGTTLKQVLAHSGRIVVERALQIVSEVNKALQFAWENRKLVHRDVKPDNIILTANGRIKLADLGLARKASDLLLQESEEIMGTPQYISPEAMLRKPLDNRSDIYSLGATLYHALTGRYPYQGETQTEIARKHLSQKLVPPRSVIPDIPEAVSRLVEIMLAKRPEHRYADSAELDRDLERVRQGQPPEHALAPDAQKTIAVASESAVPDPGAVAAVPSAPSATGTAVALPVAVPPPAPSEQTGQVSGGGKHLVIHKAAGAKIVLHSNSPAPAVAPGEGAVSLADGAAPAAPGTATLVMATAAHPKKKMSTAKMLGLIGAFVGITLAVITVLVVRAVHEKRKTPEQRELEALAKQFPAPQMTAFLAVRQAVREGRAAGDILGTVKAFQEKYPEKSALLDKVRGIAAPYIEQELTTLREARHTEELKGWQQQAKALQEKERKEQEELAKQQKAADEQARRQQEEERKRQQHEQVLAQLRQQQDNLRIQAAELGRKFSFGEARSLFVAMTQSREGDFRKWAQAEQRMFELADKLFQLVINGKEALKGFKTALPNRRGKWAVATISNKEITFETNEIDVKTGNTVKRSVPVLLTDLYPAMFSDLALAIGHKAGTGDDELNLMLGAFFLAEGNYFGMREARTRLTACAAQADAEPLLKELEVLEPLLKEKQFTEQLDRLKLMANKGDTKNAAVLGKYLKEQFPEQYQKVEGDIAKLLQGN